jgi:hypothetical protein
MFGKNADKMYQHGLGIIPVKAKGEFGIFPGWTDYCIKKPTQEQIDGWIKKCPELNIGLPLGPASSLVAIDIDKDDEFLKEIIPRSNFVKKGKVGETRFFRYKEGVIKRNIKASDDSMVVQLLSIGQQTLLPPSIHPDTGAPYTWTVGGFEDLIEDAPDLPDNIQSILNYIQERYSNPVEGLAKKGGRHDKLLGIAVASCFDGEPDEVIIQKLINYDKKHHETPWFEEEQSPEYFMNSIRKMKTVPPCPGTTRVRLTIADPSINKANDKETLEIEEIQSIGDELNEDLASNGLIKYEPIPIPKGGLLQPLYEQIQAFSRNDITPLAIASAHAYISSAMGQRFRIHRSRTNDTKLNRLNVWPRGYFLCIAPSGWGKSHGPNFMIEHIIPKVKNFNSAIRVLGGFGSAHGLVYELRDHPVCLVKAEEISGLFRLAKDGLKNKDNFAEILCDTWSSAASIIRLGSTKESKQKGDVFAQNPALTILGFTTAAGFESSLSMELNKIGLIPRFKIFDCTTWKQSDKNLKVENKADIEFIAKTFHHLINDVKVFRGMHYEDKALRGDEPQGLAEHHKAAVPHGILLSEELCVDVLEPMQVWADNLVKNLEDEHPCIPFLNRCVEHTLMTAQEHCISRYPWDDSTAAYFMNQMYPTRDMLKLSSDDLDYGFKSFKHSAYSLNERSKSLNQEGDYARVEDKILKLLSDAGPMGIVAGKLGRLVRSDKRTRVLNDLCSINTVVIFKNGKRRVYVLSNYARRFKELHPYFTLEKHRG